jgi:hypothetical protein
MAVMTSRESYMALHRDYEKALAERRKLIEALRDLQARCDALIFRPALDDARAVDRDTRRLREGLEAPRRLLRELGEEK